MEIIKILQFEDLGLKIYINFDKVLKRGSDYTFYYHDWVVTNCFTNRKLKFVEKYENQYYFTFE